MKDSITRHILSLWDFMRPKQLKEIFRKIFRQTNISDVCSCITFISVFIQLSGGVHVQAINGQVVDQKIAGQLPVGQHLAGQVDQPLAAVHASPALTPRMLQTSGLKPVVNQVNVFFRVFFNILRVYFFIYLQSFIYLTNYLSA